MKKLTLIALVTAAVISPAVAADNKDKEKDKGIPPGLQKKDKLPPGIAKKQAQETTATPTPAVPVPAPQPVPPAPATPNAPKLPEPGKTPPAPTTGQLKVDLDKRARTINTLDNKTATRRVGLDAIAKETGVSVATLQAQHRQHQEIGTAGLLMANAIAAQTKRPAGAYLRQAAEGKPWVRIAADSGVNINELDAKLARVEEAMRDAK